MTSLTSEMLFAFSEILNISTLLKNVIKYVLEIHFLSGFYSLGEHLFSTFKKSCCISYDFVNLVPTSIWLHLLANTRIWDVVSSLL